jgi:hypothetical protein
MPPEPGRTTLWQELKSWPRSVRYCFAGLAVAIFASTFVIEPLAEPDFPDRSEWPVGEIPTGIAVGAADVAADGTGSELPEGIGLHSGDPLWTAEVASDGDQVAHLDQGTVRLTEGRIALERDGSEVWHYEWEEFGPEIGVADGVVVISQSMDDLDDADYDWPGRQDTVALDLETGEEVWRDQDASFVTVFSDAVLMTECTGAQDDHIGDCTLYSRDPADLATQWSTPTYASARAVSDSPWDGAPVPDRLLMESFPTGNESRQVHVYENGEAIASVPTHDSVTLAGDTLIVYSDYDGNPADGCTVHLAGRPLGDAEPTWELDAMIRKTPDLANCGGLPTVEAHDGKLPLTIDGVPSIVDAATGDTVWAAPAEGQAIALSPEADLLVVVEWEAVHDNLVAYDAATGEERWRADTSFVSRGRATTIGSTLWIYGDASMWGWSTYDVFAYDLATGEGVALPGTVAYFLPGEVVMTAGEYEEPVLEAWPTELW